MSSSRDEVFSKPYAYEDDDGRIIYRASSLGACTGALVRARLGVSGSAPSDLMQTRFDEGHDWEARVLAIGLDIAGMVGVAEADHLAPYGRVVESDAGLQVETEVTWGNKAVRCHPDGIGIDRNTLQPHVVEVKFLGEQMFGDIVFDKGKGMSEGYKWQLAIEMLSTGLPALYVVGKKVVSEDADGGRVVELGEVWTKVFDEPPFTLKQVKARVLEVEGYVARGEMPSCPLPLMYPCPYWADHEPGAGEREEIDDEVLGEWVAVWRLAVKAKEVADKDVEFVKKAIAEQMRELGKVGGRCAGVDIAVVAEQEKGNVSWAKAYKALSAQTGERVDEDEFRGKGVAGHVRVSEAKE